MPRVGPRSSDHLATDFADVIDAGRAEILRLYEADMESASAAIARDALSRRQVMIHSDEILTDVVQSLRAGQVMIDDSYRLSSYASGVTRAERGMHPRESMGTASAFFRTTVEWVLPRIPEGPGSLEVLSIVCCALNLSLTRRLGEGTATHSGYLLGKIHGAHVEERRRIARELHDRVGMALSVTHRYLELFEMQATDDLTKAMENARRADAAAREALDHLRAVTSELRLQEPLRSLEQALQTFLENASGDVQWHLTVNGDERWASPSVRDESFLVIREALRNALKHSGADLLIVSVDISPGELRSTVMDNGTGFDHLAPPTSDGVGVSTMRERTELMGGNITFTPVSAGGVRVEVIIPLTGGKDVDPAG